jgi:hypothetical protein
MKNMVRVRYLLLTLALGVFAVIQASAQMKIGNHPTQIQPASILELESNNQALRLTQGDTLKVNGIIATEATLPDGETPYQAAEGMILYNEGDSSFYMRMNGWWHKVMSADQVNEQYFKIGGNTIAATAAFLGTKGAADSLRIGTDSSKASIVIMPNGIVNFLDSLHAAQGRIDSLFSNVLISNDSLNVANKLTVNVDSSKVANVFVMQDSVLMTNLMKAYGADTSLLSISPGGVVHKMSIDSLLGANKPTINGINSTIFHLKFGQDTAGGHTGPWIDSTSMAADSILIFNIPDAGLHVRGLMDTTAQVFGGTKSFADSVAIGQTSTPNSTFQVTGNVSLGQNLVTSGNTYNMATTNTFALYRTIIFNVNSIGSGVTVTLPDASTIPGRLYTFKKIGSATDGQLADPVTINTTASQTIDTDGTSFTLYNNFTSVTLQASGSNWVIIGH